MTAHVDILEQQESLRSPLLASVGMHGLVVAVLVAAALRPAVDVWGDRTGGGGGSVAVNVVSSVPLPGRSGPLNPVANDTESRIPQPPRKSKQAEQKRAEDPEAVALRFKKAAQRAAEIAASNQRFRANPNERPNQLYSKAGQGLASQMVQSPGGGGVGVGSGSPLGDRFGWYISTLQRLVAQNWNTSDVDARLRTAPAVIVQFRILRDGTIRDVELVQSSGNTVLDLSAKRALLDLSKAPGLPSTFERNQALIEFWFQLKR
jgi:TonB family protein